ncbi:MAG: LytTR family transcriptional regulator DNA-binding domain-containing protein [Bacilli bacterium]
MVDFIVYDDNKLILDNVKKVINNTMMKNNFAYSVRLFTCYSNEFVEIINNEGSFKIYILDIETPTKSGIDVARFIRSKDVNSVIIFLTSHNELGLTILKNELLFLSFLNKFDDYEGRLILSIEKGLRILGFKNAIRFVEGGISYTIIIDDILYITRDGVERKSIIKTSSAEFKVSKSLTSLKLLAGGNFIQTHKSCVVNNNRVTYIDKLNRIIMFDNGVSIDLLSTKYKRELKCDV